MISINEAQKRLVQAGYTLDLQSPYKELTILDAYYPSVKQYLLEQGYEGNIIVIGKRKRNVSTISDQVSHSNKSNNKMNNQCIKSDFEGSGDVKNQYVEDSDGQLSFI